MNKSFRVGHQAEYASRGIGKCGDRVHRAVGVYWEGSFATVGIDISKGNMTVRSKLIESTFVFGYYFSLCVCYREINPLS